MRRAIVLTLAWATLGHGAPAPAKPKATVTAAKKQIVKPTIKTHNVAATTPPRRPAPRPATPVEGGEGEAPSEGTQPSDPRTAALSDHILSVLHDRPLSRARVGVVVMRASDGVVLFSHNPSVAFNPASNTKMLTTAAAIAVLGGDYRYRTTVHGPLPDDSGTVTGHVTLRGTGDPSLTSSDLAALAERLHGLGIQRIEGDLVVDSTFHSDGKSAPGEAPGTALIVDRNVLAVHVEPGDVGRAPHVWLEPSGEHYVVDNKATTSKGKRSRLKITTSRDGDRLVVSVRGRIAESRGEYVDKVRLSDGALLAGWNLRSALNGFGIELVGSVRPGTISEAGEGAPLALLAAHESPPMSDICKIANKPSNNFVSEVIFKTVGAEQFGWPGTLQKGARAIGQYLNRMGLPSSAFRVVNGSGLTHENRITPSALALLLRRIYFDLSVAPDFLNSLAIGGIDGTIKHRFAGTDAVGLVRAKTGTLSGVSALSGYVGEKDDVLVFSILVEGFRARAKNEVRRAQVRMVTGMLKYLRRNAPPPPTQAPPAEPVDDSEADGDPV